MQVQENILITAALLLLLDAWVLNKNLQDGFSLLLLNSMEVAISVQIDTFLRSMQKQLQGGRRSFFGKRASLASPARDRYCLEDMFCFQRVGHLCWTKLFLPLLLQKTLLHKKMFSCKPPLGTHPNVTATDEQWSLRSRS
jgi:hypothetical protein